MIVSLEIGTWDGAAQEAPDASQPDSPVKVDPPPLPLIAPVIQPPVGKTSGGPNATGGKKKDRLFFALPNFFTVENAAKAPPLTAGEKFKITAESSFDFAQYLWYAAVAGSSQAEDQEAGYGQGAQGYGKRFGAHLADGTIENFTTSAILPSLLHQDPRYYQNGTGGVWHRTGYAISRTFVTRTDSGHHAINYSEILGSAAASVISTYSYYPRENRNLGNALSLWGSDIGYDTLTHVFKEFWPDIRRKLRPSKPPSNP